MYYLFVLIGSKDREEKVKLKEEKYGSAWDKEIKVGSPNHIN